MRKAWEFGRRPIAELLSQRGNSLFGGMGARPFGLAGDLAWQALGMDSGVPDCWETHRQALYPERAMLCSSTRSMFCALRLTYCIGSSSDFHLAAHATLCLFGRRRVETRRSFIWPAMFLSMAGHREFLCHLGQRAGPCFTRRAIYQPFGPSRLN